MTSDAEFKAALPHLIAFGKIIDRQEVDPDNGLGQLLYDTLTQILTAAEKVREKEKLISLERSIVIAMKKMGWSRKRAEKEIMAAVESGELEARQ